MADAVDPLAFIEGVAAMADAMDSMKRALEERGWSTATSEQVGAAFGGVLFATSMGGK